MTARRQRTECGDAGSPESLALMAVLGQLAGCTDRPVLEDFMRRPALPHLHVQQAAALIGGGPLWGALQPAGEGLPVQDGGVEHEGHGPRVQRLPAEGPHVGAVCRGRIEAREGFRFM